MLGYSKKGNYKFLLDNCKLTRNFNDSNHINCTHNHSHTFDIPVMYSYILVRFLNTLFFVCFLKRVK